MTDTTKTYGPLLTGRALTAASEPDEFDFLRGTKLVRKVATGKTSVLVFLAPLNGETVFIDADLEVKR